MTATHHPPAACQPAQTCTFGSWIFDIDAAAVIIRARPRPTTRIVVAQWARACGIGHDAAAGRTSLPRSGPGLDIGYAMTTDLTQPLIIATLPAGGSAYLRLIDGGHRLYRASTEGLTDLRAWVLTDDETIAIRTRR